MLPLSGIAHVSHYHVYRGLQPDFKPSLLNLVQRPADSCLCGPASNCTTVAGSTTDWSRHDLLLSRLPPSIAGTTRGRSRRRWLSRH